MPRTTTVLAALAFVASAALGAAAPKAATAGSYSYGFDNDQDNLGWAIVSGGDNITMSDAQDARSIEKLKAEFGPEFLYIRSGGDRYVVRDRALMKRAKDAARPMEEAGREIGEAVSAQVEQALGGSRDARDQARLARRIASLSRRIARLERRGESTEDLEKELDRLQRQLDDLADDSRDEHASSREERARSDRTEEASARLNKAVRHLRQEIRDILREAKSRHLAERVDD